MSRCPLTRRNLPSARNRPATHHRRRMSPSRQRVTRAVTRRVRPSANSIGLVIANVRWHQAGGPDAESNGFALCVLHHKTFDLGAFTVADGVLLVSDQANGTAGFQETLMGFHGKPVRQPQRPEWKPEPGHLEWHGR